MKWGGLDGLKQRLRIVGISGKWTPVEHGYQLRLESGAVITWFATTGRIQVQGPAKTKANVDEAIRQALVEGPELG